MVRNGDNIYSYVNLDVLYEDTLEDIEDIGISSCFHGISPQKVLIHNCSSWKRVEEINMERARYLLNTDDMLEEIPGETQG